jgi:hypothetical protein
MKDNVTEELSCYCQGRIDFDERVVQQCFEIVQVTCGIAERCLKDEKDILVDKKERLLLMLTTWGEEDYQFLFPKKNMRMLLSISLNCIRNQRKKVKVTSNKKTCRSTVPGHER